MVEALALYDVPLLELPSSPKDHWKRAPGRADNNHTRMYHGVGHALSSWENLENSCAILFSVLVQSTSKAAARAYGVIASHRGRREALEHAAEVFFVVRNVSAGHQSYFGKLMNHLGQAASRRNEIAHAIVTTINMHDDPPVCLLLPADYNSNKTTAYNKNPDDPWSSLGTTYRYSNDDLEYFVNGFMMLREATDALSGQLYHRFGRIER